MAHGGAGELPACSGLEAEAFIDGRVLVVEKHHPLIELYGVLEEATYRLYLASHRSRGEAARRLALLAEAVAGIHRGLVGLAGGGLGEAERLAEKAVEGLDTPGGWSMPCSVESGEVMVAVALLRRAERLVSLLASQGLIDRAKAEELAGALALAAWAGFQIHSQLLCRNTSSRGRGRGVSRVSHSQASQEQAGPAPRQDQ